MAEIKKIATRESYGNALKELAGEGADKLVVLDADLSAATKTEIFKKAYPNRHINCGIAEANMMCVAAGLSTMGLVPFASSFAMFAAGRAFEQVRNTIGYPHLNVKIGATHAGISVGEDGASHQCCEDFALMRSIPGMVVICPADDIEARQAVKAAYKYEGPVYLRFGRLAVPVFHNDDYKFEIGKGEVIKEGSDVSIIANGLMVNEAIEAGKALEAKGINAEIINIATIKPLDEELVIASAKKTGKVITVEEHNIIGGLGEAVCACLSENCPTPVKRIGVNDEFGHSGPALDLLKQFGLSAEHIAEVTEEFEISVDAYNFGIRKNITDAQLYLFELLHDPIKFRSIHLSKKDSVLFKLINNSSRWKGKFDDRYFDYGLITFRFNYKEMILSVKHTIYLVYSMDKHTTYYFAPIKQCADFEEAKNIAYSYLCNYSSLIKTIEQDDYIHFMLDINWNKEQDEQYIRYTNKIGGINILICQSIDGYCTMNVGSIKGNKKFKCIEDAKKIAYSFIKSGEYNNIINKNQKKGS